MRDRASVLRGGSGAHADARRKKLPRRRRHRHGICRVRPRSSGPREAAPLHTVPQTGLDHLLASAPVTRIDEYRDDYYDDAEAMDHDDDAAGRAPCLASRGLWLCERVRPCQGTSWLLKVRAPTPDKHMLRLQALDDEQEIRDRLGVREISWLASFGFTRYTLDHHTDRRISKFYIDVVRHDDGKYFVVGAISANVDGNATLERIESDLGALGGVVIHPTERKVVRALSDMARDRMEASGWVPGARRPPEVFDSDPLGRCKINADDGPRELREWNRIRSCP